MNLLSINQCLAVLMVCLSPQLAWAQLPPGTWQYHWGDEFNDNSLDLMKWSYNYPWGSTHNHQAYSSPDNVILGDGTLTLLAERKSQGGLPFTTGTISTGYNKFTFSGGYVEARIRLPSTPGSWPAFWGLYDGWPPEADIMEYPITTGGGQGYPKTDYHTAWHYTNTSGGNSAGAGRVNPGIGNLDTTYHNFGMEWRAGEWVGFYFNGQRVSEFGNASAIAQMPHMYLILNYAVGGWPGTPNTSQWPVGHTDQMKVDWVRVWKQEGTKTTNWNHTGASQDVSWNTGANWTNGSPNLAGFTANFSTVPAPEQRITWNGIRSISSIQFDGSTRYLLGHANARLLMAGANNLTGQASISVAPTSTSDVHEIRSQVELRSNLTITNHSNQPLRFTGQLRGDRGVIVNGTGNVEFTTVNAYRGNTIVDGGLLSLTGTGVIPTTPYIEVRNGGTLDVSGLNGVLLMNNNRTLNVESDSQVVGGVIATGGGIVMGSGTFQGNLSNQAGGLVRVGREGLGRASRFVIDDFESYNVGDVRDVASPPWTAHQNTSFAGIENLGGNKVLSYGWTGGFRGASRDLPEDAHIQNNEVATIFFRVNSKTDSPDHNVGLGDMATTNTINFGDFEAQVRLKSDTTSGTFAVDARNGGAFSPTLASGLQLESWYNFWMVVDQSTNTYDVFMNTGTADATLADKLNASPLSFRNGTADPLNKFLALAGSAPVDNGVRIDDLVFLSGIDLINPFNGFDPLISLDSMTMTIIGNFTQQAGAILELVIHSPGILDLLEVGGHFSAGGQLRVSLVDGAPTPQEGDVFKILDTATSSGSFDTFDLPVLDSGLAWNVTNLMTTGELGVVADVDLNGDGIVDGQDFLLIQQSDPSLIGAWQNLFGSILVSSLTANSTAVPEPTSLWTAMMIATASVSMRFWRK